MSSTDAILFYGICWDEEDHRWNWRPYIHPDMDDAEVAEASPIPVSERIEEGDDETPDQEWVDDRVPGLIVGEHCCASSPMGYIAIAESEQVASRGYPARVGNVDLPDLVRMGYEDTLRKFCEVAHYDYGALMRAGKIGWFLVSWWSE